MDLSLALARNPNAAYRVYDGKATIVLPEHAAVHVLNEVGSFVWDRLDGQRTLATIVDEVAATYEVSPDQAHQDVAAFVAALLEQKMVRQP